MNNAAFFIPEAGQLDKHMPLSREDIPPPPPPPDSKVHGANMGPIWGWQDPGGPHFGPMNFAIWATIP